MRSRNSRLIAASLVAVVGATVYAVVATAAPPGLTNVPTANPKVAGFNYPNVALARAGAN